MDSAFPIIGLSALLLIAAVPVVRGFSWSLKLALRYMERNRRMIVFTILSLSLLTGLFFLP